MKTHHWRAEWLLSLLFSILFPALLHADEASSAGAYENTVQERVHVTATRSNKNDIDIAAAVTAINAKQVLEQAPDVIAEMLRGQPGAFFQQTTPGQGIPIIRGLKGSQILHMVDGMRLNNALFRNAPNQYLGLVDSFATQRMEVVRGSQGTLYGADAMGGVLNILTQEPRYAAENWQNEGRLYSSYDSVDNGLIISARAQGGKTGWAFTGGASYQDHSSRQSGNGERLAPSAYRSKAADLKFLIDVGEDSDLMLSAQLMEQPSTPRYDELVPGFGEDEPASQQYQFEPNRRSFVHARYRVDGQSAWFEQFEAHLARQLIIDDRLTQSWLSPVLVSEENSSTLDGVTLQVNSSLPNGMSLVWGAEYYTDSIDSQRFEYSHDEDLTTPVRSRFPDGSSMDNSAVYLSADLLDTSSWDLNAGLRYSRFNIKLPASENNQSLTLNPSDLTGDLHVVYKLNSQAKLVSNIGRGFRPPNIFDLATLGPRPGNRFNIANLNIRPETVWSYDVGIKMETDRIELEVFAFYLDYTDKITSVFTGEVTADGRDVVRSENRNNVQLYGLEAGLYWAVSDAISTYAVVNYTRGEEQDDQGISFPADRIPPANGKIGLKYLFGNDWRLEPYLLFASRQNRLSPRDFRDTRINPAGTAQWGTINVLLDWQASDLLQLGLRLENLADEAYREHASGIDAPGRNFGLWVNMTF